MAVNKDNPGVFSNEQGNYIGAYNVISWRIRRSVRGRAHVFLSPELWDP